MENEILELITQCLNTNDMQYKEIQNKQFAYGQYFIKSMFKEKYTLAYVALQDDIELGVSNPKVNVSIYSTPQTLVNIDLGEEDFKPLYRAVKNLSIEIEKVNQQLLAEISCLSALFISDPEEAMTKAKSIIESKHYDFIMEGN